VLAVSVTLHEVTGSCSRARSNHSAFLPADQRSPYCAGDSADYGALGLAVVMSIGPAVSQAVYTRRQQDKNKHQQHRDDVFLFDVLYHWYTLLLLRLLSGLEPV
jgi:hypothetical protein